VATAVDTTVVIEPLETRLRSRLVVLRENREKFMGEAQRQLAALDAAIAEMDAILNPPPADASQNGTSDEVLPG
jgi:hypothetical protein